MAFICDEPIQLVNYSSKGIWELNEQAILILSRLNKPIKVLAITGKYRTGKSHVLNKFLGVKSGGFALGHTVNGCTKGIWMWGKDTEKEIVLALDTEGLTDTENNYTFDSKLFSLILLLSSYVVINIVGVLDENVLTLLGFVTQLTKIIFSEKTDKEEDEGTSYKELFPPVMFLLRDFALALESGDSLDDYLSKALKHKPGKSNKANNDTRDSITQAFPVREIMTVPIPHADSKVLQNIQEHEEILSEAFHKAVDDVCSKLSDELKIKRAKYQGELAPIRNGEAYTAFVKAIVKGLNENQRIEIPSLFEAVRDVERRRSVEQGMKLLQSQFEEIEKLLPVNETELIDRLAFTQNDIIEQLAKEAIDLDTLAQVTDELVASATQMQTNILAKNKDESRSFCKDLKGGLVDSLRKSCACQEFKTIEAFEEKKQESLIILQKKGVGPALNEILNEFDNDCVHLREILYTQLKLQKVEIEAAEEARKHQENERQIKLLREESEEKEKQAKIRDEAWKAQTEALAKKVDEDRRLWKEEKDQMQKQFEHELAQAKKANDTRLFDIAQQQCSAYSSQTHKHSGSPSKIWVGPYKRSDGTKVSGYWRRK